MRDTELWRDFIQLLAERSRSFCQGLLILSHLMTLLFNNMFPSLLRRLQHPFIRRVGFHYVIVTFATYALLLTLPHLFTSDILAAKGPVLLVTAHPDDETLFFSPIITAVLKSGTPLKILTLSKGDNYGKGAAREQEMKDACGVFEQWAVMTKPALPTDVTYERIHCEVLDVLKDDPRAQWDEKIILQEVQSHIKEWKVEAIVTFDEGGISGHENHKSVARTLINRAKAQPDFIPVYTVHTTMLLRKYLFFFDLPPTILPFVFSNIFRPVRPSYFLDHAIYVNGYDRWRTAVQAFGKHVSQFSWDRNLFLGLNRYMWFNTIERVV